MASGPARSIVSEHRAATYVLRYEELRGYAVAHHTPGSRDGLVVLLRQGVAAWMDAWARLPARPPPPAHEKPRRSSPVPDDASAQVIQILAGIALGNLQEVHA